MIKLDFKLIAEAIKAVGLSTKRAIVEEALRGLVQMHGQKTAIKKMAGLGWEGDHQTRPAAV
jgi:Arc/MetJ family transcription regulator